MIKIPSDKGQVIQSNRSDILGNIHSSFNLDLTSNYGCIKVSPRMLKVSDTASVATINGPAVNFVTFNGGINDGNGSATWAILGTKIHRNSNTPNSVWVADSSGSSPTTSSDQGDLAVFNSNLYVAAANGTLYKRVSGASSYASVDTLASTTIPAIMVVYQNRLYYIYSGSTIRSLDSSDTIATSGTYTNSINTSTEFQISWIVAGNDRLWYGTIGNNGQKGKIYEWDGSFATSTHQYLIDAQGTLSCFIKDNTPYVMDTNGKLLVFNGSSFEELDRLPIEGKSFYNTAVNSAMKFIHPHGMTLVDGRINFLINNRIGDTAGSILARCPSGIWELDDNKKIYHKASLSYTPIGSTTITDYGQNRLYRVGALVNMKVENSSASANGQILVGADFYTNATSTSSGIWTDDFNDTVKKYGYLTTIPLKSDALLDSFKSIFIDHDKFLNTSDKIWVKYRSYQQNSTEITINWVGVSGNTTIFTTTDSNIANYSAGDEVEIVAGTGGGFTSRITSIVGTSPYNVTVNDVFTGVTTGTAKARLQKWIESGTISDSDDKLSLVDLPGRDTWIQVKVCMLFTGQDQINQIIPITKSIKQK